MNLTQTAELTASNGKSGDNFGESVGINGDTVVVGVPYASGYAGAIYVYVGPQGGWTNMTETAVLTSLQQEASATP